MSRGAEADVFYVLQNLSPAFQLALPGLPAPSVCKLATEHKLRFHDCSRKYLQKDTRFATTAYVSSPVEGLLRPRFRTTSTNELGLRASATRRQNVQPDTVRCGEPGRHSLASSRKCRAHLNEPRSHLPLTTFFARQPLDLCVVVTHCMLFPSTVGADVEHKLAFLLVRIPTHETPAPSRRKAPFRWASAPA